TIGCWVQGARPFDGSPKRGELFDRVAVRAESQFAVPAAESGFALLLMPGTADLLWSGDLARMCVQILPWFRTHRMAETHQVFRCGWSRCSLLVEVGPFLNK